MIFAPRHFIERQTVSRMVIDFGLWNQEYVSSAVQRCIHVCVTPGWRQKIFLLAEAVLQGLAKSLGPLWVIWLYSWQV